MESLAAFLYSTLVPLFFSWIIPIAICNILWRNTAPEKPSLGLLVALYPLVFIGLFIGEFVARAIRPSFYYDRGDNPTQIAELMIAFFFSWSYAPVIKRLARMKQPGYTRRISLISIVRTIEIILWIPVMFCLIMFLNFIIVLFVKPAEFLNVWRYFFLGLSVLIPIGLRRWRASLEKTENQKAVTAKPLPQTQN